MRNSISKSLIILSLFIFQIPCSHAQDKKKEKDKTETNKEFQDDDDDANAQDKNTKEETSTRKKAKTEPVAVGIELGLNFPYMNYFPFSNDFSLGGRGGVVVEVNLFDKFYLQPGLFYAMNGCQGKGSYYTDATTQLAHVNSIELPVNAIFKVGSRRQFLFGAGAFIGDNISGNAVSTFKIGSSNGDDLKAIDYGLGVCLGHQSRGGFFFKARYQKGLANLNPNSYGGSIKTSCINVDFGILFGKKAKHKKKAASGDKYMEPKM